MGQVTVVRAIRGVLTRWTYLPVTKGRIQGTYPEAPTLSPSFLLLAVSIRLLTTFLFPWTFLWSFFPSRLFCPQFLGLNCSGRFLSRFLFYLSGHVKRNLKIFRDFGLAVKWWSQLGFGTRDGDLFLGSCLPPLVAVEMWLFFRFKRSYTTVSNQGRFVSQNWDHRGPDSHEVRTTRSVKDPGTEYLHLGL